MKEFLNGRVKVKTGDLTKEDVDAIVNAANSSLLGGGGVDGAIHRAGGCAIYDECEAIRRTRYPQGLPTGKAVLTTGGNLPVKYVIHTVGPIFKRNDPQMPLLLAACYHNSLSLAAEHHLSSIAFPAISTGVYGYPKSEAAVVASTAVREFLQNAPTADTIREVRFVFFSAIDEEEFLKNQRF